MNSDLGQTGINILCNLHHLLLKEVIAWNDAWAVFLSENAELSVQDTTEPQDISRTAMKADVGSLPIRETDLPD